MMSQTLSSNLGERELKISQVKEEALTHPQIIGCHEGGCLICYDGITITGLRDRFVLWRNTKWKKNRILGFVAQMLTEGINFQIGPAVDRAASAKSGAIKIINQPTEKEELVGLYVAWGNLILFQVIDWKKSIDITFPRHIPSG